MSIDAHTFSAFMWRELTLGAIDDSIRHSISKMSHLHFVSHEIYKKGFCNLEKKKKGF